MVDLAAHCFPPATILDGNGAIWGPGSPFLVTLGPSSCFLSATVWASCEVALGGLAGPDSIDWILSVKACQGSGVGLTLPSIRLNW